MYFKTSATKREIAKLLDVSTDFVVEWTKSKNQDVEQDDRGREKSDRQKWNQEVVDEIEEIRAELSEDPEVVEQVLGFAPGQNLPGGWISNGVGSGAGVDVNDFTVGLGMKVRNRGEVKGCFGIGAPCFSPAMNIASREFLRRAIAG